MRLFVVTASPARQKTDCAIVGLHEGGGLAGAGALIDAANDAGGKDNISVVLARVRGHAGPARSWWPFRR
jgi:protein phosphatase